MSIFFKITKWNMANLASKKFNRDIAGRIRIYVDKNGKYMFRSHWSTSEPFNEKGIYLFKVDYNKENNQWVEES